MKARYMLSLIAVMLASLAQSQTTTTGTINLVIVPAKVDATGAALSPEHVHSGYRVLGRRLVAGEYQWQQVGLITIPTQHGYNQSGLATGVEHCYAVVETFNFIPSPGATPVPLEGEQSAMACGTIPTPKPMQKPGPATVTLTVRS